MEVGHTNNQTDLQKDIIEEISLLKSRSKINKNYIVAYLLLLVLAPKIQFISVGVLAMAGLLTICLLVSYSVRIHTKICYAESMIASHNCIGFADEYTISIRKGKMPSSLLEKNKIKVYGTSTEHRNLKRNAKNVIINSRVKAGDLIDIIEITSDYGDSLTVIKKARKWGNVHG